MQFNVISKLKKKCYIFHMLGGDLPLLWIREKRWGEGRGINFSIGGGKSILSFVVRKQ